MHRPSGPSSMKTALSVHSAEWERWAPEAGRAWGEGASSLVSRLFTGIDSSSCDFNGLTTEVKAMQYFLETQRPCISLQVVVVRQT